MKYYTLTTIVCVATDLITSLVMLIMAGKHEAMSVVFLAMLFIVTVYFYIDTYFIFWTGKLSFLVSEEFKMLLPKAFLGIGSGFKEELSCAGNNK